MIMLDTTKEQREFDKKKALELLGVFDEAAIVYASGTTLDAENKYIIAKRHLQTAIEALAK